MSISGEQVLLRAYLESADRAPHSPTFEQLVRVARREGLAGATVLRGLMGWGHHGLLKHSSWALVTHEPVIVEIVDSGTRIQQFVEGPMSQFMVHGLVTLERANVMMYRRRGDGSPNHLSLGDLLTPLSTLPKLSTGAAMKTDDRGVLLRVFIGDSDRFEGKPLYEAIVQKAREVGLAGATVLHGAEGFGANSVVHTSKILGMSTDLPVVIEIVDIEEKILPLLPYLETMVREGMITMEHVLVLMYHHGGEEP
jgi:uncharacterized protein